MMKWLLEIFYKESMASDIGSLREIRHKSRWCSRCNHLCEKFGLMELVDLSWPQNFSNEGMTLLEI